jgi:4'-phosphopantetheinyl transferase
MHADHVDVWYADLDSPVWLDPRAEATLSADEQVKASRFCADLDRRRCRASRILLRRLLGSYLGVDPRRLRIASNAFGKPLLVGLAAASRIRFNVSHADRLAVVAVAWERDVGIDVERIRRIDEGREIAHRFFSPGEAAHVCGSAPGDQDVEFLRCWTRKEAYVKARGIGLSYPLHSFDVRPAAISPVRVASHDAADVWPCTLVDLLPVLPYVGAVALEGGPFTVSAHFARETVHEWDRTAIA